MIFLDALGNVSAHAPQVSFLDHGFLFGDSLYEVVRLYDKKFLGWKEHMERMIAGGERLGIDIRSLQSEIESRAKKLIAALNEPQAAIRIIVTRGVGALNIDWRTCASPQIFMAAWKFEASQFTKPPRLYVTQIKRNHRDALDPAIKSGNYLNNVLAFREAVSSGYDDAILLNPDGMITELTTSNLGWISNGRAYTSKLESGILSGITRRLLIEAAEIQEVLQTEEDLFKADEVFVLSTFKEVLPVREIASVSGKKKVFQTHELTLSLGRRLRDHIHKRLKNETEVF